MIDHRIEGPTEPSRMRPCEPVLKTTGKRRQLSPTADELSSRRPSPVLPDELILEILLRLPVRSLLQLRCICKSWKTLIFNPQFAKDHLRRSISDPSMTHQRLASRVFSHHCKIVTCSVQSLFENPSTLAKAVSFRMGHNCDIVGSCNGLLCLYDIYSRCVMLWNPSTRLKSERSPAVRWSDGDGVIKRHGFGYDHVNDEYKVLVVVEGLHETVTKVYTFGSNSWTTIQNFPLTPTRWAGKFVSGTLNWVAKGSVSSDQWVILSFDLEKETYAEVLPPKQDGDNLLNPELDVLNNCLCIGFYTNRTHWVVWMMKKYGVQESWTKLMMIPHEVFQISICFPAFDPLCTAENGVVLGYVSGGLVLYDSNNARLDYPRIRRKLGFGLHIYHESLVSP